MNIDLDALDAEQLDSLVNQACDRRDDVNREHLARLREDILGMIAEEGLAFHDLFPRKPRRPRAKGPFPPKYRNPFDPLQVWTGLGKRPQWMRAALRAGLSLEELAV